MPHYILMKERLATTICLPLLLLLFLGLGGAQLNAQDDSLRPLVIDEVEFLVSDVLTPPEPNADWQTMQLPLGERLGNEEDSNRIVWMRFALDAPTDTTLRSLYFYRHNLSLEVFFNGENIGGDSYRPNRQTVSWNHPLLVDIQNSNWRAAGNEVHIRFKTSYFGGTFAPFLFAEKAVLQPLFEERLFRQVRINEWLQVTGIIVTLLALVLWAVRREDFAYLYFAGMTASWTMLTTHMIVYYNPIDYRYWLPIVHLSINVWTIMFFFFLTAVSNIRNARVATTVKIWFCLAIAWNLLAPLEYWWLGAYAIHAIGNLFLIYMIARIVAQAIRIQNVLSMALCAAVLIQIGFFGHDLAMVLFTEGEAWEGAMYWSQFGFPILLAVFTANLLNRFTSALRLAESLNRDLEAKVEQSRVIIEQSYAEKHELELEQAAEKERLSIYRDLHDDVGSKLLSIVHAGRDNKLGDLARTALESLRSAVSRANSPEQTLEKFLEHLEEETRLRLESSGHELRWTQTGLIPDTILPSDVVFNLNQIFREIVSNIIRHASASQVNIYLQSNPKKFVFSVEDNGQGITSEDIKGNGLKNIKQRAEEIGATVAWEAMPEQGLRVLLELALQAASDQAELIGDRQ
ncbi:MAG: hypothetical protein DHS20C12_19330 [Pseudohongiella sp.]|nr:MAG: hypothetical protein DHS20C12_19330 [Pseudohongiella sp.]